MRPTSVQTVNEIALKIKVQDDGSWVVENLQEKIKKSTKNIGQSFNTANKSLASWMKNMAKATGMFAGLYGVIRGGVNIVKGLITDTENFDTELTQVATLVDTTQVDIDKMSDSLFGMAGAMGAVGDLTRGTYMEISASVPAKESLNELTHAAKFAAGGQADLAKSVNLGTTVLNSYGKEVGNTAHVFDVLWQVIKDGKTNAAQLSQYLGDVIDIGRETGLTFEEVGGSLAIMTQISGHTGKSVTALRGIMSAIQKPSSEAAKEARRIGANFSVAAVKAMGFENWLRHLNDAIKRNNGDTATLFGQVEALNGIYQLTRNNLQNFTDEMQKMSDVTGNNQEAYEKYLQSFQGSWNEVKNKLQALFIQVILPLMKEFAKWLRENSDGVLSFARNFISGVKTIIGFIAQFKDVIILAGKAWAVHFAISKITSWKNAFLGGMGTAGNSLKTFWGELKRSKDYFVELRADGGKTFSSMNQSLQMVASKSKLAATALGAIQTVLWTIAIDKLAELYNVLDDIHKLEAQTALKEVEYGIQDRERWNAQKVMMQSYVEQLRQIKIDHAFTFDENKKRTLEAILNTSQLNQKHNDLLNTFELHEQLEKAMSQAQGETYQEKLTWLRRHKEEYSGIIDYVEAGLAAWQIEQGMHTNLTKQYEDHIKKMYEMQNIPLPKYYQQVKKEVGNTTGALAENNGTIDEATKKMNEYLEKIGLLSGQKLKDLQRETDIYTKIVNDNAGELEVNQVALQNVKEKIEEMKTAYQNAGQEVPPELQNLTEMVDLLDYSFQGLGKEVQFSQDVIHATTPDIDLMAESIAAADEMTMTLDEHLEDLAKDLYQFSSLLLQATDFLSEFGIIGESTANMLSQVGESIGSIAGGLESLNSGFDSIAKGIFEDGDFFDYLSGGISILSGFGSIAKGIFDGIASLLSGDGVGEAIDRERQNIDISESMEEIIRQTEEVIGDTHASISLHFKEIVQEADITVSNIANYWQRARDILADLDRGTLSAQEASTSIGESFNALLAEAQRLGTEGSKEMLALIGDVRGRGLEVAEIAEYVNSKLMGNIQAISDYISTFKDIGAIKGELEALNNELANGNLTNQEAVEIQQQLILKQEELSLSIQDVAANWDFVQAGTLSTFHALETQGFSFIEITQMMGSELNWIAKTAKDAGLEVSEGLQAMTNLATFINQHQELAQRIEATQTMMQGLADTDFFNETDFNMFLTQTKQQYQEILKYTDDEEMALRLISPILQDIIKYGKSYNFVIDEETQGIINLAQEHKVLGQEEKSHYEVMNELLLAIADALGAKIPGEIRSLVSDVDVAMGSIRNQTDLWGDSLSGIEEQFGDLQDSVTALDNHYGYHMTGASIVTTTYFWLEALIAVKTKMDRELPESITHLDEKYTGTIFEMSEETQNAWLSVLEKVILKLNEDIPEETAALKAEYAITMMEMRQNTEYWESALDEIEKHMSTASQEEIPFLLQQYSDAMLNMEMDTNDFMLRLIDLGQQIGIQIPDTLTTMSDKYQYVMSEMNLSTEGLITNFRDLLQLYGQLEFGGIGSNYGVYSQEEKEQMTSKFITMQDMWQNNWQTIIQDEDSMRRFYNDLKGLQGGILDEFTKNYSGFLQLIQKELGKVQSGYYQGSGDLNPAFSSGGWFLVPPGYPDDSFPIRVESGELVRIYNRTETQAIMRQGFEPYLDSMETAVPESPGQRKLNDGIAPYFVPGKSQTINYNDFNFELKNSFEINVKSEKIDIEEIGEMLLELVDDEGRGFGNRLAERIERRLDR